MSRSSARLASKQIRAEDADIQENPIPVAAKKKTVKQQNSNTARTSAVLSSESSAEEGPEPMDVDVVVEKGQEKRETRHNRSSSKGAPDKTSMWTSRRRTSTTNKPTDINSARSKLDGVLAFMSRNDDSDDERDRLHSPPHKLKRLSSGKGINRRGVLSAMKRADAPDTQKQASLILKLFDRSVDLAKFITGHRDHIPLYPVCRDWIRSGRNMSYDLAQLSVDPTGDDKKGIYYLPKPLPLTQEQKDSGLNARIPRNSVKPSLTLEEIDSQVNSMTDTDRETLLALSTSRWKQIRTDWKLAARENELRYKHSCDVLKSMYEKSTSQAAIPLEPLLEPKVEPLDTY